MKKKLKIARGIFPVKRIVAYIVRLIDKYHVSHTFRYSILYSLCYTIESIVLFLIQIYVLVCHGSIEN